jgi:hypothetical protein
MLLTCVPIDACGVFLCVSLAHDFTLLMLLHDPKVCVAREVPTFHAQIIIGPRPVPCKASLQSNVVFDFCSSNAATTCRYSSTSANEMELTDVGRKESTLNPEHMHT